MPAKYAKLKAIADDKSLDETERLIARLKLAEIPRNANPTRVRNRCELDRPLARAYYRKFRPVPHRCCANWATRA